jgi:UDP-N-acetylglucosamine acyltransferase
MIHSTAIIDPSAKIAADVEIGPYCIVGPNVEIGTGTVLKSHVVINGPTKIGANNEFYSFSTIGEDPQDKKYAGEATLLEIGNNNLFRENITVNRGTVQGGGITKIGDDNWIMAYVHIAHDCIVGNDNTLANNATLAGHVILEDKIILGGFTLVSQFNRIGSHAFSAMGSVISRNIPPYVLVSGHMAKPVGVNVEGLKRRGFSTQQIRNIKNAYKLVYRASLTLDEALSRISDIEQEDKELVEFIEFISKQEGGIIR